MQYQAAHNSEQQFFTSMEDMASQHSFVSVADLVVDSLPRDDYGFADFRGQHHIKMDFGKLNCLKQNIFKSCFVSKVENVKLN